MFSTHTVPVLSKWNLPYTSKFYSFIGFHVYDMFCTDVLQPIDFFYMYPKIGCCIEEYRWSLCPSYTVQVPNWYARYFPPGPKMSLHLDSCAPLVKTVQPIIQIGGLVAFNLYPGQW